MQPEKAAEGKQDPQAGSRDSRDTPCSSSGELSMCVTEKHQHEGPAAHLPHAHPPHICTGARASHACYWVGGSVLQSPQGSRLVGPPMEFLYILGPSILVPILPYNLCLMSDDEFLHLFWSAAGRSLSDRHARLLCAQYP